MIPRAITRPLLGFLFSLLLLIAATLVAAAQAPATATAPAAASTDQALKPEALEALVAPIALYPDPLLALVLMASTYPLEVVQAERWVGDNKSLKDDKLKAAVDKQAWDDSVKGLVATPSVLEMMSSKLDWTQKLGDAVLAQQPDVMDAIQRLRARAQASNKLKSTPQQKVTVRQEPAGAEPGGPSRQVIAIEPAVADSVSVPYYDPGVVYGGWPYDDYPPYYFGYPGYVAAGVIATGVAFGAAYALRRWAGGNNIWGGGVNWGNRNIIANRPVNINNIGNNWTHNPAHRQGVRYGNAALQQRFGNNNLRAGAVQRMDFRGRGGQQVLNPAGDRGAGNRPGGDRGAGNRPGGDRGTGNRPGGEGRNANRGGAGTRTAARQPRATTRPAARSGGAHGNAFGNIGPGRAAGLASARGQASLGGFARAGGFAGGGFRGGGLGGGGFRGGGGGFRGGGRRSDLALKHDITLLGHLDNGLGFYRFSYNGSRKAHVGVIAQEVQSVAPTAVTRGRDGFLRVFYDRIGVKFESYEAWLAAGAHVPAGARTH
jgi:hypothetical protein